MARDDQPKSSLVSTAVGLLITFGAAHFYAGERISGSVLALAEVFALLLAVAGRDDEQVAGPVLLLLVIGLDIGSGARAVARANAGARFTWLGQLARILPLVLIAAFLAVTLTLHWSGSR